MTYDVLCARRICGLACLHVKRVSDQMVEADVGTFNDSFVWLSCEWYGYGTTVSMYIFICQHVVVTLLLNILKHKCL